MKDSGEENSLATLASRRNRALVIAWVILAFSLTATISEFRANHDHTRDKIRIQALREMDRSTEAIRGRLQIYEDALYGTRSLFEANQLVSRQMFHRYIFNLKIQQRFPGVQGIGFALRIDPRRLKEHTKQLRSQGFADYQVHPP